MINSKGIKLRKCNFTLLEVNKNHYLFHCRHVDDIDLFAGGVSERSVRGGIVGPTFGCIIAKQFEALRKGDRFWYENKQASFTPGML